MTESEIQEARKIAHNVRAWCLVTFKRATYFSSTLNGYCAICSFNIFSQLRSKNIEATFVENKSRNHAFVLVGEWVIDVTATQFGNYPKVMIRKIEELGHYWRVGKVAKTTEEVKAIIRDWPRSQQPKIIL